MKKLIVFAICTLLTACGGGGSDKEQGDATKATQQRPEMKPITNIKMGRNINVLFLHSKTTDAADYFSDEELKISFDKVKGILKYNGIINNYSVNYAQYENSYSSKDMLDLYVKQNIYPEDKALSESNWMQIKQNRDLINKSDIIINRVSFDKASTNGGFWGAGTNSIGYTPFLSQITDLRKDIKYFNSPYDKGDISYDYPHNNALDSAFKLSGYDRILAHEFIHALGYAAHDNGVEYHSAELLSERTIEDVKYFENRPANDYSYGDLFSVMGDATFSLMLSPSAIDFLGGNLDSVSIYNNNLVSLKPGQVIKVFLKQDKKVTHGITYDNIYYLTISKMKSGGYTNTLNGNVYFDGGDHSIQGNLNGLIIRLVKTEISRESTPSTILLDAMPPLNDLTYTLQIKHGIVIGKIVNIEYLYEDEDTSKIKVSYL